MKLFSTMAGTGALVLFLGACAQQEEVIERTPIYAKDGTIIAYEPVVGAPGSAIDPPAEPDASEDAGIPPADEILTSKPPQP